MQKINNNCFESLLLTHVNEVLAVAKELAPQIAIVKEQPFESNEPIDARTTHFFYIFMCLVASDRFPNGRLPYLPDYVGLLQVSRS